MLEPHGPEAILKALQELLKSSIWEMWIFHIMVCLSTHKAVTCLNLEGCELVWCHCAIIARPKVFSLILVFVSVCTRMP